MARVRISRAAQTDFDTIIDYLAEVASHQVAVTYAEQLQASLSRIADFPGLGSPLADLGPGTRVASVPPYLIFYDGGPDSETVYILRILHGRRDITPELIGRGRAP